MPLLLLLFVFLIGANSKSEECKQCEFLVDLMHKEWEGNATNEDMGEFAKFICIEFKIEDNFVCDLIITEFEPEVMYILGQIIFEPHQICGLLLTDCGTFFDPFNATWSIPMPPGQPTPIDKQAPKPGNPTLRVLHLTDVHMDTQYGVGLEAQCGEPQCCRPYHDPNEVDAKRDVIQPAGKWGTVGVCDLPYWTLCNMLDFISKNHKDLDYVMVSGDLESHAVYEYTKDIHAAMVKNISDTIRSYFPTIPVYFAIGNHEGVPIDNFAPHFAPKEYQMDWLYDTMADAWKGWIPSDQVKDFKYRGSYRVQLYPGLRLLSIHTTLGGDPINFWMYMNQTDPDGTFTWVVNELLAAEQAGDKVWVVAHIPGGDSEALEGWALNYYNAINRFQNTISAQFFGHTHSDNFYMVYTDPKDATSRPTSVVYAAPSATTYSEYNPAYRIYTVDGNYQGSTYQVIDYEEWYLNLTEANAKPNDNPVWKQLFASMNQEFGLKSQVPSEWNNFIERMKNDDDLFNKYQMVRKRRNQYDGVTRCTGQCKMNQLCDFRQFHHESALCSDLTGATGGPTGKVLYRKSQTATPMASNLDVIDAANKFKNSRRRR